jgi:hypothetical protein
MERISGRHPSCLLTTSGLVGFALALVGLFALSVRVLSSVEVLQDNTAEGSGQRVVAPPAPKEIVDPQLKHLVIDKVYFPKNREDAGVASVHGWIEGKFVEGNLRLQRTAKYNAKDGM